jgi:hypothetical protein
MGTEQTPVDNGGQGPQQQNPPVESGGQGFDFEKGYNELRPEYTRTSQRLSEYEALFVSLHDPDPEVQQAAMAALGLELDTGSQGGQPQTPQEWEDPLEKEIHELRATVDDLRSAREQESQREENERIIGLRDQFIGESIDYIENEKNVKFNEKEEEALGNLAIAMTDAEGVPDVVAAYNLLYGDEGVLETNRQRWIESKTGAKQPPLGSTIPAEQKPQTKSDRINYIDERMRALDQQQ